MFEEDKKLKDSQPAISDTPSARIGTNLSYTKTNKLVMALYMVTDIMDKEEPLRNKLRTLGADIISDINLSPLDVSLKIAQIVSLLDIASTVNIVSVMNSNILRNEFTELDQSIKEFVGGPRPELRSIDLSSFFLEEKTALPGRASDSLKRHASIGVQKGSTLMKALKGLTTPGADSFKKAGYSRTSNFDVLKKQRREEIKDIIKKNNGNATITDIKNNAYGSLVSCGDKTLQRELISMAKDGVLNKTGEKRWSRYSLK